MNKFLLFSLLFAFSVCLEAQISARLMNEMDISQTQITFVYGGDIWVVDKTGGTASQLTNSQGEEAFPKFSPDGTQIAYTASYNGNDDVFVIPVTGGIPTRITYASHYDRMIDWHPDGESLIFASRRQSSTPRVNHFYKVNKNGGVPERLSIPYGELGTFSPDGKQLAYTTKITENYPFKRYRGGLTSDVLIYNFDSNKIDRVTSETTIDSKPAWGKDLLYFLSDRDESMRLNVWSYSTADKQLKQVTNFTDFDITHLSSGPEELVFANGGKLYTMAYGSDSPKEVEVKVVSDLSTEIEQAKDVSKSISGMSASHGGKRIVFEARGELFNVPVKEGYTLNMTNSSGAFDQNPAWSPDGKHIAYWSDKSGEYELYLHNAEKHSEKKITNRNKGFGYALHWSPDSEKIAFVDETNTLYYIDINSGSTTEIDNYNWNLGHGPRYGYPISWSPDSKYVSYAKGMENANNAIFIFSLQDKNAQQVTSGFYSDFYPVFSNDGQYLFFLTNREFSAAYGDMDDTWIYPNSTKLAVISLNKDAPYLLSPKNDAVEKSEGSEEKNGKEKDEDKSDNTKSLRIEWGDMESRMVLLPPGSGNYSTLMSFDDKIAYLKYPNTGSGERNSSLMMYDLKEREEKKIMDGVNGVKQTADGKAILVSASGKYGVIQAAPDQKIKDPIPTDGLVMQLNPKEEWRQIFIDTWRRHRDFFYDEDMQQVDWEGMKDRYYPLIEDARTRWDVGTIQRHLVSELSAGHTYARGGDTENVERIETGFLGVDLELVNNKFRIQKIIKPAPWDTEIRSPFDRSGTGVSEGDYIHAVNGKPLDPEKDPYAAFEGLSGKTVMLTISKSGNSADAEEKVIQTLSRGEESQLRYLAWIESNRKMVDKLSDGKLGYIYMSNTSARGQLELVRMYYGQLDKKGYIIDERFNGGGQLADRFLELMKRPVVYNLYWRHGKDHQWPIKANEGPMGMLINGWAGSGGDALPWAFQELEAGPIVGERTLGILVGPATGHRLIDGGFITVPGARLYDNDGHWFWEGEGVAPDIEVWDDPNILMQGRDPQMESVVDEVLKLLEGNLVSPTPAPPMEDRTANGLKGN